MYVCNVFFSKFIILTPNTELALLDITTISRKPQGNMSGMEKDEKKAEAGANERETQQSVTHIPSVGACPGCIPGSQAPSVPTSLCDLAGNNIEISSLDLQKPVLWSRPTHTTQVLF